MKKYASISAAVLTAMAGLGASAFGNDECTGAIQIFDGSNAASNLAAVTTTPTCIGSNDVWYRYVATSSGSLQASTCGTRTFDTTIAIFDGCPENGGVQVACNDDFCGLGSTVTWAAVRGQTYFVRFAGWAGQRGTADLSIGLPLPTGIDAFGFATPDPVIAGDSTLLEVYVFPGQNPDSTGIAVSIDTSSVRGGNATQQMYDDGSNGDQFASDNVFSYLQAVALEQAEQTYQFPYIVTDLEARSYTSSIFLNVDVSNPDALFADFTPASGFVGAVTLYEVFVIPAVFPDSTGIVVTADFSELLGSSSQQLFDDGTNGDLAAGDGTYSFAITIDNSLTAGSYLVSVTSVIDDQGRVDDFLPDASFVVRVPSQWEEIADGGGDAGDLPASAQIPTGTDPLTSIGGTIETGSDVDMFSITICDVDSFNATTVGNGTAFDTMLWLFNADGTGVVANDDSQSSLQSTLTNTFVAANGNYYLAIDRFFVRAIDENGAFLWATTAEAPPSNPNPVAGWSGTGFSGGDYQITLAGTCFAAGGPSCDYDFNQDENVDLLDAQQMAQVFVGLISPGAGWLDGDLNGDENADLTDAQLLAAFVVTGQCNL